MEGIFFPPHLIHTIAISFPILSPELHNTVAFQGFLSSQFLTQIHTEGPSTRDTSHFGDILQQHTPHPAQEARSVLQRGSQVLGTACRHERSHSCIYIRQGALLSNTACCAGCETPKKTIQTWEPAAPGSCDPSHMQSHVQQTPLTGIRAAPGLWSATVLHRHPVWQALNTKKGSCTDLKGMTLEAQDQYFKIWASPTFISTTMQAFLHGRITTKWWCFWGCSALVLLCGLVFVLFVFCCNLVGWFSF